MSMTKTALLEFLRSHRYGVEASNTKEGPPEAALIGFTEREPVFNAFADSRERTGKSEGS